MKKFYQLQWLLAFILMGTLVHAQDSGKFATARLVESYQTRNYSRIAIVYENGQAETIKLKDLAGLKTMEESMEVQAENQRIINKFLTDMDNKGYELVNMLSPGADALVSFMVFRKRDK